MNILFVQTGGTIDKDYPSNGSTYNFVIDRPAIELVLAKVRCSFDYRSIELLKKDSTDLSEEDVSKIVQTCANATEDRIVITHGTDNMINTAERLSRIPNKTIVLTGSMVPARFNNSDADFNIGCAITAAQLANAGVYIAMSGRVYPWDHVRKDYNEGKFVDTSDI